MCRIDRPDVPVGNWTPVTARLVDFTHIPPGGHWRILYWHFSDPRLWTVAEVPQDLVIVENKIVKVPMWLKNALAEHRPRFIGKRVRGRWVYGDATTGFFAEGGKNMGHALADREYYLSWWTGFPFYINRLAWNDPETGDRRYSVHTFTLGSKLPIMRGVDPEPQSLDKVKRLVDISLGLKSFEHWLQEVNSGA